MGLRIQTVLECVEFRRLRSGVKQDGSKWYSMRVEDEDANSIDVSIRNTAFLHDCESLEKGDYVNLPVLIVAVDGKDGYSYCQLADYPEPCPEPDSEA